MRAYLMQLFDFLLFFGIVSLIDNYKVLLKLFRKDQPPEYHHVLQTDVELSESLTDSHPESALTNRKKK